MSDSATGVVLAAIVGLVTGYAYSCFVDEVLLVAIVFLGVSAVVCAALSAKLFRSESGFLLCGLTHWCTWPLGVWAAYPRSDGLPGIVISIVLFLPIHVTTLFWIALGLRSRMGRNARSP